MDSSLGDGSLDVDKKLVLLSFARLLLKEREKTRKQRREEATQKTTRT